MIKHQTVMATWLVSVLDQLVAQGLDRRDLTAELWASESASVTPTRQLELVLVRRLWQRAVDLSPDPLLGLKVGAALPLQAMNIIALLIMHSVNLREAITQTIRYQHLISNSGHLSVRTKPGGVVLHYAITPCPVPMSYAQVDSLFAGWIGIVRRCSMRLNAWPKGVALTSPRADLHAQYATYFGCPVKFGEAVASLEFDNDVLDAPFSGADPELLSLMRRHAEFMLRAQNRTDSLVASVRAAAALHGFARISCDLVANELGISTRTLQRRLTEVNTTFRRLIEAARMDSAFVLLDGGQYTILEIGEQLAYSEPSSFFHAVKAYWGATPKEIRDSRSTNGADAQAIEKKRF